MIDVQYLQITYLYCCVCKQQYEVDRMWIGSGNNFYKADPKTYGWNSLCIDGKTYLFCPKHKVNVVVDGVVLNEK